MSFQAKVSRLSLSEGVPKDCTYPKSKTAQNTENLHYTSIAVASSNAEIVFLRLPTQGLIRPNDAGPTWKKINDKLNGAANCTRSFGRHSQNSDMIYRATGKAVSTGAFESRQCSRRCSIRPNQITQSSIILRRNRTSQAPS